MTNPATRVGVIGVVRLMGVVVLCSFLVSAYTLYRQGAEARDAQQRLCEASNRSRYGGSDYLRIVIRVSLLRQGYRDLADEVRDVPAIDCDTGRLRPLPPEANP